MRVVRVSQPIPTIVQSFCNLMWISMPKKWIFHSVYHKNKLFISIIINNNDDIIHKIHREYPFDIIQNRENDIWGLAIDCSEEILRSVEGGELA